MPAGGLSWKVAAVIVTVIAATAAVAITLTRTGGPRPAQPDYVLSDGQHFQAGESTGGYRFYVTKASPEVPLAQVGMDLLRDGGVVGAISNMTECAGALGSKPTDDFILYASYTDEIGCALSIGDWITLVLYHNDLGHTYTVRLLDATGGVLVSKALAAPLPPTVTFGSPTTLPDDSVVIPVAAVSAPYPPGRYGGGLNVGCGPDLIPWSDTLRFGVLVQNMCTTGSLEDRDGDGNLSTGDAFVFTRFGTVPPGSLALSIRWLDQEGALATVRFP